jgi:hypothetical protein
LATFTDNQDIGSAQINGHTGRYWQRRHLTLFPGTAEAAAGVFEKQIDAHYPVSFGETQPILEPKRGEQAA